MSRPTEPAPFLFDPNPPTLPPATPAPTLPDVNPPPRPRRGRRKRKPELGDVPYTRGSDTSEAAAASLRAIASELSRTIMEFVTEAGEHGLTAEEAGLLLGKKRGADPYVFNARQTAASRLSLLLKRGDVVDSGRRRMTASDRPARVHVLPQYAPPPAQTEASSLPSKVSPRET